MLHIKMFIPINKQVYLYDSYISIHTYVHLCDHDLPLAINGIYSSKTDEDQYQKMKGSKRYSLSTLIG